MKRWFATALCLIIAVLPLCALAEPTPEPPFNDPFESRDGAAEADAADGIRLTIDSTEVWLGFDSAPEYSSVLDGIVQASFYAYEDDSDLLYELYLLFPDSVEPGASISPNDAGQAGKDSSVVLIISDSKSEKYYSAGMLNGASYPIGSDFTIDIDTIENGRYTGQLTAALVALDLISGEVVDTLKIESAPFGFTLGSASHERHFDPIPTDAAKDLRKV